MRPTHVAGAFCVFAGAVFAALLNPGDLMVATLSATLMLVSGIALYLEIDNVRS